MRPLPTDRIATRAKTGTPGDNQFALEFVANYKEQGFVHELQGRNIRLRTRPYRRGYEPDGGGIARRHDRLFV